jgi:sphingomyelin phosphodiesterase
MKMLILRSWVFLALISLVAGSLLDDIITAFEEAVDCTSCHALLLPLEALAYFGDDDFVSTVTAVCQELGVEDSDVCAGTVAQQGPILANNLREISTTGEMGTKICDAVLGLCQPPAVNPYTVQFPKPAPANPKVWKSSGKAPFQVVHFSDVHIDRQYTARNLYCVPVGR